MTGTRSKDTKITEVTAGSRTRFRVVLDTGTHADGRRRQTTKTFDSRKAAKAWLDATRTDVRNEAHVPRDRRTVTHLIDGWLDSRIDVKPATRECYRNSLAHAKGRLGHVTAQDVTRADLSRVVVAMLTETVPGGHLRSASTVRLLVGLLKQVFAWAVEDGWCRTNPAVKVKVPKDDRLGGETMTCWTRAERTAFLTHTATDPLAVGWMLTSVGMRRGEVLGLRWADVQLDSVDPTVTIRRTRGLVRRTIVEGTPKSPASHRTLHLRDLPGLVALLRATRKAQVTQQLAAGPAYAQGDKHGGYVVADGLGQPVHPETYSRRFGALCKAAGVRVIRLHDARHTSVTLMLGAGVPLHLAAAWHGHDKVTMLRVYAHAMPDDLASAGAALAL